MDADVLKFDEAFYGSLRQTAAIIGHVALWLFSKQLTEYSVAKTLFWIAVAGTILSLPISACSLAFHDWTEQHLGSARALSRSSTPRPPRPSRSSV